MLSSHQTSKAIFVEKKFPTCLRALHLIILGWVKPLATAATENSDATNLFADFRVSKVFQQGVEVVVVVVDDRVRSDPLHHDFVGLVVELRLDEVPRLWQESSTSITGSSHVDASKEILTSRRGRTWQSCGQNQWSKVFMQTFYQEIQHLSSY